MQPEFTYGNAVANASLATKQFYLVNILSTGKLALVAALGGLALGVLQDSPGAGEAGNVMIGGISKVQAGGTIAIGNYLTSDANGKAVAVTAAGQHVIGQALSAASSGEVVTVLLHGPGNQNVTAEVRGASPAYAATADGTVTIGRAPFAGVVMNVKYVANVAISGANTNYRSISLINKGQAGAGTTTVASKAFTSGVDAVAYDETDITKSVTGSDLVVAEGDIMALTSAHTGGSGLADPGGLAIVSFRRTA